MKTMFRSALIVSCFFTFCFGRYFYNPSKVVNVGQDKAMVIWGEVSGEQMNYKARYVDFSMNPLAEPFDIFSAEDIFFNRNAEFLMLKSIDSPSTEFLFGSTTILGKIFHTPLDTTNAFHVDCHRWQQCPMGSLGWHYGAIGFENDFMTFSNDGGYISFHRFDNNHNTIFQYFSDRNATQLKGAAATDSSCLFTWLQVHRYEEDTVKTGLFLTHMDGSGQIIADSIEVARYPNLPQDYEIDILPELEIASLNDSTYQLFVLEKDSLALKSHLLSPSGKIISREVISLPYPVYEDWTYRLKIDVFHLSNFSHGQRALFISGTYYADKDIRLNLLVYFDEDGKYTDYMAEDTLQLFPNNRFLVLAGEHTFLNSGIKGDEVYLYKYEDFTKIDSVKIGSAVSVKQMKRVVPAKLSLEQNYPNPFNPQTTIGFYLPHNKDVNITIYDVLGRKVKTLLSGQLSAGSHKVIWKGVNESGLRCASGIYYYRLRAGEFTEMKKMLLIR